MGGCDLLENSYLCGISNNVLIRLAAASWLWFAWKFVPLWYQQQLLHTVTRIKLRCDLLENSYLCGISNNMIEFLLTNRVLWFAWKFVPLWYQQQRWLSSAKSSTCCDLLENSYLCGISNNICRSLRRTRTVVICLKIRTFVVSATTVVRARIVFTCCDLLENSYLCGISNNIYLVRDTRRQVVICLKIRTFVVSATTIRNILSIISCCDLLENSYLCGISNNRFLTLPVSNSLWFAWKFVPLWYQQQL